MTCGDSCGETWQVPLPISRDRIYPRCVWCRGENYGPAVLAYSAGEIPCASTTNCGGYVPESYRIVRDRDKSDRPLGTAVCDHGHPEVEPWSDCWGRECWYGHPVTSGVATCTCPGSGREPTVEKGDAITAYERYLAMVAGTRTLFPDQRAGQAHSNVLAEEFPAISEQVTTDPFYDDAKLPAFLAEVQPLLDGEAA